jgi:hypothetical protein
VGAGERLSSRLLGRKIEQNETWQPAMSEMGHSLQIVASRKSIDVRFAPEATVKLQTVICRNGPILLKNALVETVKAH